jgi:hypothetical protein
VCIHLPDGRWYSPLPRSRPISMAVGAPISVAQCADPSKADVERVAAQYFAALEALFEANKAAAGYPTGKLVFVGSDKEKDKHKEN